MSSYAAIYNKKRLPELDSLFLYVLLSELLLLVSSVFDSSFFTSKVSEVINSRSSNSTSSVNFDFLKCRHVDREYSFYTYITTHFSDSESFCSTSTSQLNNGTFEELSSGFLSFFNFVIHSNCVSCFEFREIFFSNVLVLYVL